MKLRRIAVVAVFIAAVMLIQSCGGGGSLSPNGDVLYGDSGFLFALDSAKYNYLADYQGKLEYTDEELDRLYQAMNKRQLAYANGNITCYFAVIPNAQTVYSEYMPDEYGNISENTLLAQLDAYVKDKGGINLFNLYQPLYKAREKGQLYDNTSNTVNALGAYYITEALLARLQTDGISKKNKLDPSLLDMITESEDEGRDLATLSGGKIMNRSYTLTIPEDSAKYMLAGNESTFYSTYVRIGFKDDIPTSPALLINYNKATDFEAFLPVLSSTFGGVGYVSGYEYKTGAVNALYPKAAVQFIYEDELYTLLDDAINGTYNVALKPGDDPYTTSMPQLIGEVATDSDTVCIAGTVEDGAVITVSGSTFDTFEATAQAGRFFISVNLPKGSDTVSLTAKVEGKDISAPLELNVSGGADLTVFAGKNSQLHYPDTLADYYCTNLFKESTLDSLASKLERKLEKIRDASGKDTKLVFLIPPDCITAYPETATDEMVANRTSTYSRLQQIEDYFADNDDIIIINLTDTMLENKSLGKLYYQTDTHWNTLGSYLGYYKLMSVIAEEFPAAAPRELSEYNVYQSWDSGGDLVSFLGFNQGVANELKTFCVPNFTNRATITNYHDGSENYAYSDQLRCVVDNDELPNAIMITDSFGANLFDFVSDAFGTLVRQTMWTYTTDLKLCAEIQPDYYIQVMVERNMGSLYVN